MVLFKDPPAKEECPICFLPMPTKLIDCMSLLDVTILSIPIFNFAAANMELAEESTKAHYSCCGKDICRVCMHSLCMSRNMGNCLFCNATTSKTLVEKVAELTRQVEVNDPSTICMLANSYRLGINGFQHPAGLVTGNQALC